MTAKRRTKGSGSLERDKRRPKSNWTMVWTDANGLRVKQSSGTTDKTEAERILRQRLKGVEDGVPVAAQKGTLTLGAALDAVVANQEAEGRKDIASTHQRIRHVLRIFSPRRLLVRISTEHLRTYSRRRKREGAANATVNRELAVVRRAFTLAVHDRTLDYAPHVEMFKETNVRTGFFNRADVVALVAFLPPVLADLAWFAFLSGWRKREMLDLQVQQVDLDAGVVRLERGTTKNGDARELTLYPELREVVERRMASIAELREHGIICPYLFHWPVGHQRAGLQVRGHYEQWRKACTAAGLPGRLLHDQRRSAVRNMNRAGIARGVAMKITGHKTESIYQRYDIVDTEVMREATDRLSKWHRRQVS